MLYVVATPIGNLGDITERARIILDEVNVVLCEDTRVTSKLMASMKIRPSLRAFHEHTDQIARKKIVDDLVAGTSMAIVTDAGTPGISDPGGFLVADAVAAGVKVVPIPGASAITAALSVAGIALDRFTFMGFPPNKKGREKFFGEVDAIEHAVVLYESTHRIAKTLEQLVPLKRSLIVFRELTKIHETIYRGNAEKILKEIEATSDRGEFVIIVSPK
ncbi:MAG: 16S rRNA (cytidine(1402)-2'-O)-methyltransferase [Patescibacteria group bacterium]|jgi:16S rRNA (cytidine1402-2'-O)-methyltransferase